MNIQGWQWVIILAIVLLLFGAPKLPKLAKSMGESMRIFKSEVKTMREDENPKDRETAQERPAVEGRVIDAEGTSRRADDAQAPAAEQPTRAPRDDRA
ncbi:Sec-independent protein translocase subunit TatA [Nesterenkonia flava]|uniref:Sec-independent protein translocase protein TatA n=1 Tax=Nesterenkonia flava TaxID=469799 RepID=A0ABU1FPU6_9MICC|nr:Sec-independent protein translocase subunit TatA [Nesterenkonia flava]MDR5710679.1 Sec-independent protein translocase subunit TatA [Nesterenkonia flava]